MKKIFIILFTFLLVVISLVSFSQGDSVKQDTAAARKEQEATNKFVTELVTKTSIADFQKWVYENVPAKKSDEFLQLYRFFINQKFAESKKK